jgi:hypothetical protein
MLSIGPQFDWGYAAGLTAAREEIVRLLRDEVAVELGIGEPAIPSRYEESTADTLNRIADLIEKGGGSE